MIYLRVKPRVMALAGETLLLKDVAGFLADASCQLNEMRVMLPKSAGVWQVDALQLILQIREKHPDEVVNVLGDGLGWLHREQLSQKVGRVKRANGVQAILLLMLIICGAAGLCTIAYATAQPFWLIPLCAMSVLAGAAFCYICASPAIAMKSYANGGGHAIENLDHSKRNKKLMQKRGK